jgi:hypothetical protein
MIKRGTEPHQDSSANGEGWGDDGHALIDAKEGQVSGCLGVGRESEGWTV